MLRFVLLFCCALACAAPVRAAGPYDDLLKYAPANANALLLVDVKGAYASPLAKSEKWSTKGDPENRGGLGFVPSDAEAVVVAADVNLNTLARNNQVGLVKVRSLPNVRELAAREGGSNDEIAGQLAALSPRDVYFTVLPGSTLVAVHPADRQFTSRYVKAAAANKVGTLSPYLKKAAEGAGANTVTIAVDLEDAIDKTLLKLGLPASPTVAKKGKGVDLNLLATFLSQVKGLTFSAKVTDQITGRIAVDFPIEPGRFRNTLPDMLREIIEDQGMAIDGLDNWKAEFTDTTFSLSGPLAVADLKRIISLFAFPNPAGEPEPDAKGSEPTAGATKRYIQGVSAVLADIGRTKGQASYEKTATWHEKAADQIEHLSRRHVDPVATEMATQAANRLRAIGQSLRGVPIDTKALTAQERVTSRGGGLSVGFGVSWWGFRPQLIENPVYVESNVPQIRSQIAKVVEDDKQRRAEAWELIDKGMHEAKSAVAKKYKISF